MNSSVVVPPLELRNRLIQFIQSIVSDNLDTLYVDVNGVDVVNHKNTINMMLDLKMSILDILQELNIVSIKDRGDSAFVANLISNVFGLFGTAKNCNRIFNLLIKNSVAPSSISGGRTQIPAISRLTDNKVLQSLSDEEIDSLEYNHYDQKKKLSLPVIDMDKRLRSGGKAFFMSERIEMKKEVLELYQSNELFTVKNIQYLTNKYDCTKNSLFSFLSELGCTKHKLSIGKNPIILFDILQDLYVKSTDIENDVGRFVSIKEILEYNGYEMYNIQKDGELLIKKARIFYPYLETSWNMSNLAISNWTR